MNLRKSRRLPTGMISTMVQKYGHAAAPRRGQPQSALARTDQADYLILVAFARLHLRHLQRTTCRARPADPGRTSGIAGACWPFSGERGMDARPGHGPAWPRLARRRPPLVHLAAVCLRD